ncbi:MAG: collagen-binding domain-containing protein, partial [Pseudolysinimonas sp.]
GSGKLDVLSGYARVTDTTGMSVTADNRLYKASQNSYVKAQSGVQTTIAGNTGSSYTATTGSFASEFQASSFTTLAAKSVSYASVTSSVGVFQVVGPATNTGELHLTLTANKVNVWNITASALAGLTALNFDGGVVPSNDTPLIINVTDAGAVSLNAIRFNGGDYSSFALWNFPNATSLTLTGASKFSGSILATNADFTDANGSDFNGQIVAKSINVTTSSELHHHTFTPTIPDVPTKTTVAGSWSTTSQCVTPSNQLVVNAVTGVSYTWTAGGTGTFASYSASGLIGTYAFTVAVTDASLYTLGANPTSYSVTFTSPTTCTTPPTCIADSLVSYTYSTATNSGVVTVPSVAGSTGKLCTSFYVTATSWKYSGSTLWPQTLDQNNPMPAKDGSFKVEYPGSYPYGATVTCGQGDIYASFTELPVPTSVLNGPSDPYAEFFLHQMGFQGPSPTYIQQTTGCNVSTPVTPTVTPITACGVYGSVVPASTPGVVYSITVAPINGQGAWQVTATPAANFFFNGSQTVTFSGNLGTHTDCVQATQPGLTPAVCTEGTSTATTAYITLAATLHLSYTVDSSSTVYGPGATVELTPGTHTVSATAASGYTNTGAASFEVIVAATPGCDQAVDYVKPTVNDQLCVAGSGELKSGSLVFDDTENVTYYLGGVAPANAITGAQKVDLAPDTYTVWAVAGDGYFISGTAGLKQVSFTVTISKADGCDTATLYVAPKVSDEVCNEADGGADNGTVTFVLQDHLTYVFDGTTVDADHLAFSVAHGDHTLVVTAADGYYVTGENVVQKSYTITVGEPDVTCDELTTLPTDPYASPEQCVAGSLTGEKSDGAITIVYAAHVTWEISNDTDGIKHAVDVLPNVADNGINEFPYAAGSYHVWATPEAGYILTTTSFAVLVHKPTVDCTLPTDAFLPTGATWTSQVCNNGKTVQPTITVEPFVGVSYAIDGNPIASITTTVTTGYHVITASADDPSNTVETALWTPTLLATTAVCGDLTTLAFTGSTPGGWLVVALLLLQAGVALLAIRFVRLRRIAVRTLAD